MAGLTVVQDLASVSISPSEENNSPQLLQQEDTLAASLVAGHLSSHTRRAYAKDAQDFTNWINGQDLSLQTLTKGDILLYRRF